MKHTNLSLSGVIFGLIIAGGGLFRYFIMWPDTDKGLIVALLGLIIIGVSWNYAGRIQLDNENKKIKNTLTDLEQYIVDNKV